MGVCFHVYILSSLSSGETVEDYSRTNQGSPRAYSDPASTPPVAPTVAGPGGAPLAAPVVTSSAAPYGSVSSSSPLASTATSHISAAAAAAANMGRC